MPIILPEAGFGTRVTDALAASPIPTLTPEEAYSRDIRPVRIGLLNLMPAPAIEATERQWLGALGSHTLQVEPVLLKFDDDERSNGSRKDYLECYTPFSEAAESGLDGLIITGDNLEIKKQEGIATVEPLGLEQIRYAQKLNAVIQWSRSNVFSTVYSCLAGHYGLNVLHGLPRIIHDPKTVGVYKHRVLDGTHPFTAHLNSNFISPHSRYGHVDPENLDAVQSMRVLSVSDEVGWVIAADKNQAGGEDLFLQGHPEYEKYDLNAEYLRDREAAIREGRPLPFVPANYFVDDDPTKHVDHSWRTDARSLHSNWLQYLYNHFSRQAS